MVRIGRVKLIATLLLACLSNIVMTQDSNLFRSPVSYDTRLSGSFAEPRSAHFHAGIDYKQYRGVPYDTVYAVADGYISRINVKPDGYGNALYIDHDSGYTSVYAHLHHFNNDIQAYISDLLIKKRQHKIEHYPTPSSLKVKRGDYIGIIGNTGRSFGAHLHFEIRKTDSETPINPSLFELKPVDLLRPTIKGVMIYNLNPDGEVYTKRYYKAYESSPGQYSLNQKTIASDGVIVGVGIHAYDTMNGASNHNGVYGVTLQNNGDVIYQYRMDSISFEHSRYIHAHMDYEAKRNNKYISKCFKSDTNPLGIYETTLYNGQIINSDVVPISLDLDVYDYEGNSSSISFSLIKSMDDSSFHSRIDSSYLKVLPTDNLRGQKGNYNWEASPGLVDKPEYIAIDSYSDTLAFESHTLVPLFRHIKITYNNHETKSLNKALLAYTDNNGKAISLGGKVIDSIGLVTFTNKLETFWLGYDTIPPKIRIISLPNQSSSRLKFIMTDNFDPAYSRDHLKFELLIDDEWKLCQHDIKDNSVWHDVIRYPNPKTHEIMIKVTDSRGNTKTEQRTVRY